jgi:chemotaxis protein methyltransferase CheR
VVERTGVKVELPGPEREPSGQVRDPSLDRLDVSDLEMSLLLDCVRQLSGYAFHDYAPLPVRRRVLERVRAERVGSVAALIERVLHEPESLRALVDALSSPGGELFGDVHFYAAVRSYVVRWLRTFPTVRIWVAGNYLDAYALAIALREEGLHRFLRIYATEPSQSAVERAKQAPLEPHQIWNAERRYAESGGRLTLEHYLPRGEFSDEVRADLVFSKHHLPTDGSFNDFQLIVATHVNDLYSPAAAYRVHRTIYQSLARFGLLYLGVTAQLGANPHSHAYELTPHCEGLFRRVR